MEIYTNRIRLITVLSNSNMKFIQIKTYGSDSVGLSIEAVLATVVGSIFISGLLIVGYASLLFSIMGVVALVSLFLSLAPLFIVSVLL